MAELMHSPTGEPTALRAVRLVLEGHVQGVGFRPFVYRLAVREGISGYVLNRVGQVEVLACATAESIAVFCECLLTEAPALSRPRLVLTEESAVPDSQRFTIRTSVADASAQVFVPADCFLCDDCRRELADPGNRRFRYPFINCTQCGPRYTLINELPYDRDNTSMARFALCAECLAEYESPGDRRYHAEPIACPACGPQLAWRTSEESTNCRGSRALDAAVAALQAGRIVAVKGVGGYHLLCDATNDLAIARLRRRKRRPHKPFAVMVPRDGSDGFATVQRLARVTADELACLASPVRPVTIVTARDDCKLPHSIAPGLREIGLILPYSPLHELLLTDIGGPLIATSANVSGEPVLTRAADVELRLADVADGFLHHDRPIVRPADDPVVRRIGGQMRPLRLGRGNAPMEIELPWEQTRPIIALGGQMKTTVTLSWGHRAVVTPHIGDMDSPRSLNVLERVVEDLQSLYGVTVERIACDAHPGYTTHRWARSHSLPALLVWHHHAHASALVAEAGGGDAWLVFAWDGVGLGADGSLWGGEALYGEPGDWRRVASLRPFRQPGGNIAGREPWRSAAALHWACGRSWADAPAESGLLEKAHRRGLNSPMTSAAGRLFDAAAALVTGRHFVSYEAEGPMRLEALCRSPAQPLSLPCARGEDGILRSDWEPLLPVLTNSHLSARERAEYFHASMARVLVDQAERLARDLNIRRVGLCGGVFQNRVLSEIAIDELTGAGFDVCLSAQLPCNDAALSLGQAAELAAAKPPC